MSDWNIGLNDVSEEAQAQKDKVASKDTQIAAQQTQLSKQADELEELQNSLNDALHKLTSESNRALRLEKDLAKSNDDLQNEKISLQNTTVALDSARRQLKEKDLENRELLSHIDTLSHQSGEQKGRTAQLEKEKSTLSNRVQELEANLKHLSSVPSSKLPRASSRPRTSSLSNMRITNLELELEDVQRQVSAKEQELRTVTQKLNMEVTRAENEKSSIERTLTKRVSELEMHLEEKEDELEYLRNGAGGSGDREAELMQRIDEDEAKIHALEMLIGDAEDVNVVRDALRKTEKQLQGEREKLAECTRRQVELVQEKEEALDELEDSRDRIKSLEREVEERETFISALKRQSSSDSSRFPPPNQQTVEDIERLLSAIHRLRHERDELRRQLKFLEMEHKFNLEELEKMRSTTPAPPRSEYSDDYGLDLTVAALGVVIDHLASEADHTVDLLAQRDAILQRTELDLQELRLQMGAHQESLEETTVHRGEVQKQLEAKEVAWNKRLEEVTAASEEAKEAVTQLDAQLTDMSHALEDAESERDSLRLQVENLSTDLRTAQDELAEAESRYTTRALSGTIEELEKRILRRNEQIGLHQHDIKRLETNMRLQEERISELTCELETMLAEKNAMVEDCADAREARDDAVSRCEVLEMETETLREETVTAETLIHVIFDTVNKSRSRIHMLTSEALHANAYAERLEMERNDALRSVDEVSLALDDVQEHLYISTADTQQATVALASSQVELNRLSSLINSSDNGHSHTEQRIAQLQGDLETCMAQRDEVSGQLDDLRQAAKASDLIWEASKAELEKEHVEEMASVLEETQTRYDACEAERQESVKELTEAKAELAKQVIAIDDGIAQCKRMSQELQETRSGWEEERTRLEANLESLKTDLERLRRPTTAQISRSQEDSSAQLRRLQDELTTLTSRLDEQTTKLAQTTAEADRLNSALKQRSTDLAEAEERCRDLDALNAELRRDVDSIQSELNNAQNQIAELETEITQYQQDNTALEAEVQREMSLTRYLQSQVKDLEERLASETAKHEQCRALLARTEKSANTAEVNFNMQTSHHKREMSQIQRELSNLRAKPNLDHIVAELEERNNEMEELLRAKCNEIEENDDKTLEMLKENKKLATKVESLTRKVQNLQTKLAAAKASNSAPTTAQSHEDVPASGDSSRGVSPANSQPSLSSFPRSRSTTMTSSAETTFTAATTSSRAPPPNRPSPPLQASSSSSRVSPPTSSAQPLSSRPRSTTVSSTHNPTSTPNSRMPANRIASGPSSLPRPKTPERRAFSRAGHRAAASPDKYDPPPSAVGKKRAAPDDFANIPAQAFTADSVPDQHAETGTPRLQKVMNNIHTGFTPMRHKGSRPLISVSPKRPTAALPIMNDLTNNPEPVEEKQPTKRSWLGKIRGAQVPLQGRF
ncbi:hypothetical protein CPB85DRAFT_1265213 [Mucidula mucida]|nr:hypothetical protein CPB85DRAFT_1265213 [Mucidula mucida]